MQKTTKAIAFALALTLVMVMLPAFAAVFHSDVRVKLSIGQRQVIYIHPSRRIHSKGSRQQRRNRRAYR